MPEPSMYMRTAACWYGCEWGVEKCGRVAACWGLILSGFNYAFFFFLNVCELCEHFWLIGVTWAGIGVPHLLDQVWISRTWSCSADTDRIKMSTLAVRGFLVLLPTVVRWEMDLLAPRLARTWEWACWSPRRPGESWDTVVAEADGALLVMCSWLHSGKVTCR